MDRLADRPARRPAHLVGAPLHHRRERLRQGQRCGFGPGTWLHLTGGTKGHVLPHDWLETVKEFINMPVARIYGMAELCAYSRYNVPP